MANNFPVEIFVPVAIVAGLLITILIVFICLRSSASKEMKLVQTNMALKKEILENGFKAEATVQSAEIAGSIVEGGVVTGDIWMIFDAVFQVRIPDTGEDYLYQRSSKTVPKQYSDNIKPGNVLPVYVHRDDKNLILFDFDKDSPERRISFYDR